MKIEDEIDKLELLEVYHVETSDNSDQVRVVFDTGASSNMSGLPGRLHEIFPKTDYNIMISGYDGSKCIVDLVGLNEDSKRELYCKKMPPGLVLLSGQQYAAEGAAILYKDEGVVIQLEEEELKSLKAFVEQFTVLKKMKVNNGIYEVTTRNSHVKGETEEGFMVIEEALTGRANRFFNTKVHVSNGTDRVLSMLMMGLSLEDLKLLVKHKSLSGMPPDLTERVINTFEHRHGRTPDIITLAIPVNRRNRSGLMDRPEELTKVGQRIEVDCAESDYNEERTEKEKKSKKLMANGGAIAFAVCVDCYSGYMISVLLTSTGDAIKFVKRFVEEYRNIGHEIKTFAADSGVVSQSKYQVFEPEVETYLRAEGIQIHRAEPSNHQMGTSTVENAIGKIKKLVNIAVTYILLNPAFQQTGFTEKQIKQLWGVLIFWATTVQNLKPCPREQDKTRYEVMNGVKPNMQNIRMLPIFSIVLIPRDGRELHNGINKTTHRIGMYVGPTLSTTGAIRVAYLSKKKKVQITITSQFTPASDGWGLNIHQNVNRGLQTLIQLENKNEHQDDEIIEVENDLVTTTDVDKIYTDNTTVEQEVKSTTVEQEVHIVKDNSNIVDEDDVDNESIENEDEPEPVIEDERKEEVSDHPKKNKKKPRKRSKKEKKSKEVNEEEKPKKVKEKKKGKVKFVESYDKTYKTTSAQSTERYKNRTKQVEEALLADWITHEVVCYYLSFTDMKIYKIVEWDEIKESDSGNGNQVTQERQMKIEVLEEQGFKAVTENVPRSFMMALHDPRWGEPARKEFKTLIDSKAIVKISKELAEEILKKKGADLVILFPVYETKEKNGIWVDKVRLVGDGRTHYSAEFTYAATPSREEFLLLTHLIAAMDWPYFHVDEIRAFLNAPYKGGNKPVITKFRGDNNNYFEVLGALYGLKSSPRDYQKVVIDRLLSIGFKKLAFCACIFVYKQDDNVVFIYDFVDDFIVTGNNYECVVRKINELREKATTTDPIEDANKVLGMQLTRNKEKKVIEVTMKDKIEEVCMKWDIQNTERKRKVPMPSRGYIVREEEFEELSEEDRIELDKSEVGQYLAIVGCLVWLSGVRLDIVFSTMYLTWSTKSPKKHHLKMARYVLAYLYHTKEVPLVLGGDLSINNKVELTAYSDASLGTGPKGRSIKANMLKLGNEAGSIVAKASTSTSVYTSSFEAELDGVTSAYKTSLKILNIFKELGIEVEGGIVNLHNDNLAMVKFVQGEGVAKGIRHVELRMYYLREKYLEGNVILHYMEGKNLPVDQLTKIGSYNQFYKFREEVMGLRLWSKWNELEKEKEEEEGETVET